MKRAAIIDLGTNMFKILIIEIDDEGNTEDIFSIKMPVKMGREGIANKRISDKAFNRCISSMKVFRGYLDFYEIPNKDVIAMATSGIRSTENGIEFLEQTKELTDIDVQIISGEQEAEYIYKGVKSGMGINSETPVLIMDIGGGSTEFIIANKDKVFWAQSFELGASRLLEKFVHENPISESEVKEIERYLDEVLVPLKEQMKGLDVKDLIGCSGSFSTFTFLLLGKSFHTDEELDMLSYHFTKEKFDGINKFLQSSTVDERIHLKEMNKDRADMIVVAGILTNYILETFNINDITYSAYSMRHGVVSDIVNN